MLGAAERDDDRSSGARLRRVRLGEQHADVARRADENVVRVTPQPLVCNDLRRNPDAHQVDALLSGQPRGVRALLAGRECRGARLQPRPDEHLATFAERGGCPRELGRVRDLSIADGRRLVSALQALPAQIGEVLALEPELTGLAARLAQAHSLFFIGRVRGFPVAREGAQKFKEITYRHAEAYPTSELKHGPLALIDESVPTVAIVPADDLTERNLGALHEIAARGTIQVEIRDGEDNRRVERIRIERARFMGI